MRFPVSIHTRLVLSHLLVSLISVILIAAFAGSTFFNAARTEIENNLEDLALATGNGLRLALQDMIENNRDGDRVRATIARLLANHPQLYYDVFTTDGTRLASNQENLLDKIGANTNREVWQALSDETGRGQAVRLSPQGEEVFYAAVPIRVEGVTLGAVRLGIPLEPALLPARRLLALLLLVSLLVAMGVSLFGWLLANTISRPIQDLTQASTSLARGDLSVRVTPTGPHELHRLSESFNFMARRLQDHIDELRAFVANASHELRTPLTVVKLRTEALRDGAMEEPALAEQFLADIEDEVNRLVRMVNDLLDLSRMEAGLSPNKRTQINLGTIATEVSETFSIRAHRAGVDLQLQMDSDLPLVLGEEDQIRRVFYNLVDNAIKFTPKGGQVQLSLQAGRQRKTIRLVVTDTGVGISSSDLIHIFERFYRAEATRPRSNTARGSGLGLAIAKSIVESHGGKMGVSSHVGSGSTFWADFPAHLN